MYSYVRTVSIQRKIGKAISPSTLLLDVVHPSEKALATVLCQFQDTIDEVVESLLPNRLTDYLYGLAETFNLFFRDCRVEGSPEEGSRLVLCELTARILKQGLEILGLETVDRM